MQSETLVGESATLASSTVASSGPPPGLAARGPIGSFSLFEESTTPDRVTLALLALSEVTPTLAGVASRASAGLLRGRSAAHRSLRCRLRVLLGGNSTSLTISLLFD